MENETEKGEGEGRVEREGKEEGRKETEGERRRGRQESEVIAIDPHHIHVCRISAIITLRF